MQSKNRAWQLVIAKIAVSALVLPNGFSPSDLGVDYFFSINPGGRREKFSSSQGHLALETEENAEQEKQLGWEREGGRGEGTAFQ